MPAKHEQITANDIRGPGLDDRVLVGKARLRLRKQHVELVVGQNDDKSSPSARSCLTIRHPTRDRVRRHGCRRSRRSISTARPAPYSRGDRASASRPRSVARFALCGSGLRSDRLRWRLGIRLRRIITDLYVLRSRRTRKGVIGQTGLVRDSEVSSPTRILLMNGASGDKRSI
jgi:hypothetical protein